MASAEIPDWLGCPLCHGPLDRLDADAVRCPQDDLIFPVEDGIIRLLLPEARDSAVAFAAGYDVRRRAQGWRRLDSTEIAALPAQSPTGWEPLYWAVRRQSFRRLKTIIAAQQAQADRLLRIVDMGAGIGWLANRLAGEGHAVIALDISDSDAFGLGAARRLRAASGASFTLVQASLEQPPLQRGQVDLLIFNASLHYVDGVVDTLHHCLDFLSPSGQLVILDSPVVKNRRKPNPAWQGSQQLVEADLRSVGAPMALHRVWRGPRWWWRVARGSLTGDAFRLPLITLRRVPAGRD